MDNINKLWRQLADRKGATFWTLRGGLLFAVVVLVVKSVQTVEDFQAASVSYETQKNELLWMQSNAHLVVNQSSDNGQPKRPSQVDIIDPVSLLAKKHGLVIARYNVNAQDDLQLWLQDAAYENTVRWLDAVSRIDGLVIDSLTIRNTGDPGLIDINLKLAFLSQTTEKVH